MHRTQSIDYGIVLEGEIWLVLDDGSQTPLGPGDVVVQRGTDHAWENRSHEPVRIVVRARRRRLHRGPRRRALRPGARRMIIVTGAAGGIGAATVECCGRAVTRCSALDLRDGFDVTDPEAWADARRRARRRARQRRRHHAPGPRGRGGARATSTACWRSTPTGPLLGIQAVLGRMPRGGSIVNVCSLAALTGHYTAAYTASKWALRGLSRAASLELGDARDPRQRRLPRLHRHADDRLGAGPLPGRE